MASALPGNPVRCQFWRSCAVGSWPGHNLSTGPGGVSSIDYVPLGAFGRIFRLESDSRAKNLGAF